MDPHHSPWQRAMVLIATAAIAASALVVAPAVTRSPDVTAQADTGCALNSAKGDIQHVIYLQFDNTHLLRDDPNVPSDLEQMPHLKNFIESNGTMLSNDHTVLISHTGTGILSTLTGNYPDRFGQPVSNSFRYFNPNGTTNPGVTFAYWTAPLFDPSTPTPTDTTPQMINEAGKISPAPWVPYTRAGCDFGSVATANTVLENTAIDIPTVFGAGSPEAQEVAADGGAAGTQSFADFVGIGIHCAQGSSVCADSDHLRPDLLPDEPGGYTGYDGVFGAKYVNPVINPNGDPAGSLEDLNGDVIADFNGHIGFPGFDGMEPKVTLAYVAQMQEAGIPITYGYISDVHDEHGTSGNQHFAYGPGEAGYVGQLQEYDQAFADFFDRLQADGINKTNTLFVITVDEGDHFVGDAPTPAGCDGVTTPCNYDRVGEINANLSAMIRTEFGDLTPFTVHSDDAPTVYVTGNPSRTDPAVRKLEREAAQLSWLNPYTGQVQTDITQALADPVTEKTLHMITADPARTPTFTLFADPDWFFFASGNPATCGTPAQCAFIPPRSPQSFAWNHGDIQEDIASTWIGIVGPGVENLGRLDTVWTDHTDVRPTMLSLLGLEDDYINDGRVISEVLSGFATPPQLRLHRGSFQRLAAAYKQLNATFGIFSMAALKISTEALASGTGPGDDDEYTDKEAAIANWTAQRDALATTMRNTLASVAFDGQELDLRAARALTNQANALIDEIATAAAAD
jgi:hypothetical protein